MKFKRYLFPFLKAAYTLAFVILVAPSLASAMDPDLLVHLPLDDAQTAGSATDISGNGNNGSISGASYVNESGDGSPSSLDFNGSGTVNLGGLDVNGSGVTLAAWVRADSFTGNNFDGRIISKASGIATDRHVFMLSTTRRGNTDDVVLLGRVRIDGDTANFRANTGLLQTGEWYHVAMVYDESAMTLYLDGEVVASAGLTGSIDQDSSVDVAVGSQPNGSNAWDGLIDDVRIFQRGLSAGELAEIASGGAPADTGGAVAEGDSDIDVWYGLNQVAGNIGRSQRWVNVLGKVTDPDGISSLSYTLNGGASVALSIGSNDRRLFNEGDFNIDLDRADLQQGANLVEITAIDTQGSETSTTVTVNFNRDRVWPSVYTVDWSTLSSIQEGVEILDGNWELTPNGIRTVETGYDRLFAVGEVTWDEYELTSSFILHDYAEDEFAGVGVIGPWVGHTDDPNPGQQPKAGFLPFGSQTWTAYFPNGGASRVQTGGHLEPKDRRTFPFVLEQKYNFRYRVERVSPNSDDLRYQARVWADGTPEPTQWDVEDVDTTSGVTDGSVVFVAHFTDATFGDISVLPLSGTPFVGDPPPGDTNEPPVAVEDNYSTL